MANQMLLDAIDEVLSRLDVMSDEQLQKKYDNHKGGPVGRVFLDAEAFLAFLENERVEEYTLPVKVSSIESYIGKSIETHRELIGQIKEIAVFNDEVHQLAA